MRAIFILTLTISLLASLPHSLYSESAEQKKTMIGGYGELHFNHSRDNTGESNNILDFHRFVLFLNHNFSEKWSFTAEIELEHNFVKSGQGELELEQAHINYHASELFNFQVGVLLPSVGLINERHEPPLFLSVERPDYSKYIIPTTWFGNGLALYGNHSNFSYKLTVMEGLKGDEITLDSGIRGARQKGFKANADSPLINFRLDFRGIPGLMAGASYSYNRAVTAENQPIPLHIYEFHLKYDRNSFMVVFEAGKIGYENGTLKASTGFYFDLGYNIGSLLKWKTAVYPWFRYTRYNTASATRDETDPGAFRVSKWLAGIAVKPLRNIIFKMEYGVEKRGVENTKKTVINVGAGYMF
jgi:hypothetical protein